MLRQQARSVLALSVTMAAAAVSPAAAQTAPAAFSAVEFDEIDHVYAMNAVVPPPGSFRQDAGLVAQPAPAATKKPSPVFGALSRASSVLSGVGSVVSASGEIGRALQITDDVAKVAPVTTALGMAGNRQFDALVQTYMLPRVSPTGAVMLQDFLSAQKEYKSHFGTTQQQAAAAPPEQLAVYAKGALRHYTIASNGWVRIDDPNTKMIVIIKPDVGKLYLIDAGSKSVRTGNYTRSASASNGSTAGPNGTAAVNDRVDTLGQTTLDGVQATGFRTQSTLRVAGAGSACPDTTITSTRVEYFARLRVASDAANASPAAQRPDASGCEPASTVAHAGSKVPNDQLLVYQANTVEKKTAADGSDRYTVVIERGNVQERSAADTTPFDIPSGMRQVSAEFSRGQTVALHNVFTRRSSGGMAVKRGYPEDGTYYDGSYVLYVTSTGPRGLRRS